MNLNRVKRTIKKEVLGLAEKTIQSALDESCEFALNEYKNVKYDGPVDHIKVYSYKYGNTFEFIASGRGVRSIEYGAHGNYGDNVRQHGGTNFWYFPSDGHGRDWMRTRNADFKKRKKYFGIVDEGRPLRRSEIDALIEENNLNHPEDILNRRKILRSMGEKTKEPYWEMDSKWIYTEGNDAQNVMLHAKQHFQDLIRTKK